MPLSTALALAIASSVNATGLPGRPPTGPLARDDARRYDVSFEVTLVSDTEFRPRRDGDELRFVDRNGRQTAGFRRFNHKFELNASSFVMPVAAITTWSRTDLTSLRTQVWGDGRQLDASSFQRDLTVNLPYGMQSAVTDLPSFNGRDLRWEASQQTIVWSSIIDDAAAVELPWPDSYPAEVADGLAPQRFIESGHPDFRRVITELFGNDVTAVAPYVAAKRIAGHVARNFRVTQTDVIRIYGGNIDGFDVVGARRSMELGFGTDADMVCVTVALMKAAGIPARPVIGVWEEEAREGGREKLDSWVEFYLHGAGWVPVNIEKLNDVSSWREAGYNQAWPEFGTWDELNERVPIAFDFVPVGWDSAQLPAVYGWFADPSPDSTGYPVQLIKIELEDRGRVR
ncbi:MAG: transglutaminase family protein [Phycisphaerales bacterium]